MQYSKSINPLDYHPKLLSKSGTLWVLSLIFLVSKKLSKNTVIYLAPAVSKNSKEVSRTRVNRS